MRAGSRRPAWVFARIRADRITAGLDCSECRRKPGRRRGRRNCHGLRRTTYGNCVESMHDALGFFGSGSLVAVCEYEDDQGDVVLLDREEDAEDACSGGGMIAASRVATVVQLP